MCETQDNLIKEGQYVIVKKLKFKKVYKVVTNGTIMLGKDQVRMQEIIGKRFWSTFALEPMKEARRVYYLKEVSQTETLHDLLEEFPSGSDNRTISDDGMSQKLSREEILHLQESGKTGKEIIGSLIENNKSFVDRTQYSQEKYLKKKGQKYLKYITICKPSISLLQDVYFKLDSTKIISLRMDTLAQLISYSDVQSDGLYILYDSGSHGLPAAALLGRIGANTEGQLIILHPGHVPSRTAINAMNFPEEQLNRMIHVNIYSFLRLYYQGEQAVWDKISQKAKFQSVSVSKKFKKSEECYNIPKANNVDNNELLNITNETQDTITQSMEIVNGLHSTIDEAQNNINEPSDISQGIIPEKCSINRASKHKLTESTEDETIDGTVPTRPKWLLQTQQAVNLVQNKKARGLVIVAREHPTNIVTALLPFLGASRPFVIYHLHNEPLQETYMTLKQTYKIINLKLFSNFLRSYQILPDRTHPDILTTGTGGYLLTGYLVEL